MDDLVYCNNIATLFNIFLFLRKLLEGPPVQREPDLQCIHNTWNLFHLHYEGTDRHIHIEMMLDMSNMSGDALEQLRLSLT